MTAENPSPKPIHKPRVLLIINPFASAVSAKTRAAVEHGLMSQDLTVVETESRNHATALARKAAADGMDAVVVLSGDGALNEAANGLAGSDTALGALPGGSTNVFARTLGMSRHVDKATEQFAEALGRGAVRSMSLGSANGRYFLVNAGIGFDAAVVHQAERHPRMKKMLGQGVFVYAANTTWLRHYSHRHPHFTIELPEGPTVDSGYFSICLNSNPYTFLGPRALNVAPGMSGEKGLSLVTLQSLNLRALLGVTRRTLGSGESVARHKKVQRHDELSGFTVVGNGPVPYQVDGDYLGDAERIVITHEPHQLQVIDPRA
ncbi:MAG TPA: diacylglycerol kinase family protein [Acidimicrobiales bacterium]|nr:diacylglycerol kinase family protein [Acidimicrobiales bacterium]